MCLKLKKNVSKPFYSLECFCFIEANQSKVNIKQQQQCVCTMEQNLFGSLRDEDCRGFWLVSH